MHSLRQTHTSTDLRTPGLYLWSKQIWQEWLGWKKNEGERKSLSVWEFRCRCTWTNSVLSRVWNDRFLPRFNKAASLLFFKKNTSCRPTNTQYICWTSQVLRLGKYSRPPVVLKIRGYHLCRGSKWPSLVSMQFVKNHLYEKHSRHVKTCNLYCSLSDCPHL